jgi:hypothetical protein
MLSEGKKEDMIPTTKRRHIQKGKTHNKLCEILYGEGREEVNPKP